MEFDRREALLTTAGLTWILSLGGCEWIFEKIRNRPVRKDIRSLAANDPILQTYREGIALMRALPASDRRHWYNVAQVHLDHCPHGNWFFLPWHRAYLIMIENIIRELTGEKSFAMPYWDWRCLQKLPAPFWETGSVLNPTTPVSNPADAFSRAIGPSDAADPSFVGVNTLNDILDETDFELFASGPPADGTLRGDGTTGSLEGTPHNYIHGTFILGTMGDYLSPLDPIFWLHHCVLDYFWFAWNSRGNSNMSDPAWANFNMTMFTDGQGNPIGQKVGLMPLAPLLSYRFADPTGCIRPFRPIDENVLKGFLERATQVPIKPVGEFPIPPRPLALDALRSPRATFDLPPEPLRAAVEGSGQRLLLRIGNVTPPPNDGTAVRVFVDLPEGADPSPSSANYAGAFAFFTDAHHPMAFNTNVDLTKVLRRLGGTADRTVTFVAVGRRETEAVPAPVRIGSLSLAVIEAKQMPRPLQ